METELFWGSPLTAAWPEIGDVFQRQLPEVCSSFSSKRSTRMTWECRNGWPASTMLSRLSDSNGSFSADTRSSIFAPGTGVSSLVTCGKCCSTHAVFPGRISNEKRLEAMVRGHLKGDRNYTTEIHKVLTLEILHRLFLDNPERGGFGGRIGVPAALSAVHCGIA